MSTTVGMPVTIRADDREPPELLRALGRIEGVTLRVERMDIGDYEIAPGVFCERKGGADVLASVIDKRLFTQIKEARDHGVQLIFLIEDDPFAAARNVHENAVSGALSYIVAIERLPMVCVPARMTPRLIADMARHHVHGLGYTINLREARPKDPVEGLLYLLQGLPGVGRARAQALLSHFPSVRRMMAASVDELAAVDGLGRKTAQSIVDVLDRVFQ